MEDWILYAGLGLLALLLMTFLLALRSVWSRISPLLDQFTNTKGEFELPKISIKNAIGWAIYKAAESVDFSKLLGNFGRTK